MGKENKFLGKKRNSKDINFIDNNSNTENSTKNIDDNCDNINTYEEQEKNHINLDKNNNKKNKTKKRRDSCSIYIIRRKEFLLEIITMKKRIRELKQNENIKKLLNRLYKENLENLTEENHNLLLENYNCYNDMDFRR